MINQSKKIFIILILGQLLSCPNFLFATISNNEIDNLILKAKYYSNLAKHDSFEICFNTAIALSEKNKYLKGEADANLLYANDLFGSNKGYVKALPYLIRAKQQYQSIEDSVGLANCYLEIGISTWGEKLYEQSIEANTKAYNIFISNKNFKSASTAQFLVGVNLIELNKTEDAKIALQNAYELAHKLNDTLRILEINLAKGDIGYKEKKYSTAIQLFKNTNQSFLKFKSSQGIIVSTIRIGKCYIELNKLDSAEIFLLDGYKNAVSKNYNIGIIESSKYLTKLYKQKNDYKNLSKFQEIYFETNDSLSNQQTTRAVTELLNQVVINDKQAEINALNLQQKTYRYLMILLAIIIALGAFTIYLFYRSSKLKQRLNDKLMQSNIELQFSQERVLKLQKYKESFLANITHELRTPLNAIKGIADLLQFESTVDEKNELLTSLKKSSQHLLNMVNDFLDFSKLKEGKLTLRRHPFQLSSVLKTAINLLKVNADEKGIELKLITTNLPETILADESRLLQILVNVIGNAIKFTNKGSVTLTVNAAIIDDNNCKLEFKIIDTGIGISAEKIKLIFEDYQQADENIAANFGGTGLGLGICKRLIEQHHGSIICESELGTGTTFIINIPYEYLKIDSLKIQENNFDDLADKHLNILIADDTPMNVLVADKLIQRKMPLAKIFKAVNGTETVALATSHKMDVILMDIIMPEMDGFEATKNIRKFNQQPAPFIIGMSAGTGEDLIEKCYQNGMNDFLSKPFNPEALYSKLQLVIESRKS